MNFSTTETPRRIIIFVVHTLIIYQEKLPFTGSIKINNTNYCLFIIHRYETAINSKRGIKYSDPTGNSLIKIIPFKKKASVCRNLHSSRYQFTNP